LLSINVQIF